MDLYTLNPSSFLITNAIDIFDSLIWTERYNEAGEVTLVLPSNDQSKALVPEGTLLWTPDSREVALIDTVSDEAGELTCQGQFLSGFLQNRILRDTWSTAKDAWKIVGAPGAIATTIVREMCGAGGLIASAVLPGTNGTYEVIPNLTIAAAPSGTSVTVAIPYGNVYDGVKQACDLDGLGFTLYPPNVGDGTGALTFLVYKGQDRTSAQSTNSVVAFDPALDSLADIKTLRSLAGYKSAAFAWAKGIGTQSQVGSAFVTGTATLNSWSRRTLMVDASDVNAADYTNAELTSVLNKKAQNALANNNYVRMSDGQLVPQNAFKYGTDYTLGDIVELRGSSSIAQYARISEYIRAQDAQGSRAYPTLSVL